ncbi:MAG: hypothetical protein ACOCQW_01265 [Halanaerobiaceae bacterium]
MNIKEYLKNNVRRKDLYTYLLNNLEGMAEEFLDNWNDMYPKDDERDLKKKIQEDLDNYHNPAEEYQKVEKQLDRKLVDEEIDIIFRAFNETVMNLVEKRFSGIK